MSDHTPAHQVMADTGFEDTPATASDDQAPRAVVLKLQSVTKRFNLYKSGLHRLMHWLGVPVKPVDSIATIRDVSFEVRSGECLALIGQNGAGKSTLLKLITGTMAPSAGRIDVNQSISAILELGLGFNPEFTGRENVRHSGGMLGHAPSLIESLMGEIEAFAEIGEFFDKPLRTYSSGMQARLAFALATAIRPEILIVDEVLSVGDAYFQHKSFARIREFRDKGTTIILVTHSLGDVRELCNRVILLDRGAVMRDGLPDEVVDYYNALIAEKENAKLSIEQRRMKNGWLHTEFGDGRARMDDINIYREGEETPSHIFRVGEMCEVRAIIRILQPLEELVIGHRIVDRTGHVVWGTNTHHTRQKLSNLKASQVVHSTLRFRCDLGPGSYALCFGLHSQDTHVADCYHKVENQIVFEVMNASEAFFIGSSHLHADFEITLSAQQERIAG